MRSNSKENTEPTKRLGSICFYYSPKKQLHQQMQALLANFADIQEVTAIVTYLIRGLQVAYPIGGFTVAYLIRDETL